MKPNLTSTRPSRKDGETNPGKAAALAAVKKTRTFRLSVDLDESAYLELKTQALREQRRGVELVRDAIKNYLEKAS